VHVLAVEYDLRLPGCRSLKEKRAVLRPVLDGLRNRHPVAVAEVGRHDEWQRAGVGVATVSGSPGHAAEVMAEADRFVWSFPELEVLEAVSRWLEED
jgi:uncharacterized protein YlxP (DUF503 family)